MQFISRYNTSFMAFVYKKYNRIFKNYDFYSEYLLRNCPNEYYETLEGDLREYCNWQIERKAENGKGTKKRGHTQEKSGTTRPR